MMMILLDCCSQTSVQGTLAFDSKLFRTVFHVESSFQIVSRGLSPFYS